VGALLLVEIIKFNNNNNCRYLNNNKSYKNQDYMINNIINKIKILIILYKIFNYKMVK
jgi:hypothetical protein